MGWTYGVLRGESRGMALELNTAWGCPPLKLTFPSSMGRRPDEGRQQNCLCSNQKGIVAKLETLDDNSKPKGSSRVRGECKT